MVYASKSDKLPSKNIVFFEPNTSNISRAEENSNVVGPVIMIPTTEKEKQEGIYVDGALSGTLL